MSVDATGIPPLRNEAVLTSRVRTAGLCILALAGLIESVYCRHTMQSDGISYLDMGDAMMRGDWKMAINAYWSPLYPFLQGLALRILKPSAYSEFTVVHGVNFLIYLFALGCFDFLLREAVASRRGREESEGTPGRLPPWAVMAVGYSVFLWSSLSLITMDRVTPDVLMAGFLYLAMGMVLQLWQRPESVSRFIVLGAVLGVGYLAKAPFFPLSFLILAIAWLLIGDWRRAVPRVLAAVLVFLAVSGPWFMALSRAKGRFTFGDSAKSNYLMFVNGASPSWYFQKLGDAKGHYAHTARKIFDAPPIYEFATPLKGTIPIWYDPSYWSDGAVPRVTIVRQLQTIHHWVAAYLDMLFTTQASLLVGFIVLCFMPGRSLLVRQMTARWPVWFTGLAGLGMYAMVYVDLRYIAAFFTLFWVGLYAGLVMPPGRDGKRLVSLITLAVAIAIAGPTLSAAAGHFSEAVKGRPHTQWQASQDLERMGVAPGDRVARIGGLFGVDWARLSRVTVVAEVPRANAREFWCGSRKLQQQVIETFRRLGVTAIVAEQVPSDGVFEPGPEWRRLGDGRFYGMRLSPQGKEENQGEPR